MDQEIKLKPWKKQFFECKKIGPTPPLNKEGFWEKPEHGISDEFKDAKRPPKADKQGL